jgi:uncharacterized protein YqeY
MIIKIKNDQLQARKNKDVLQTNLLTVLISEIQKKAKDDKDRDVTDEDCLITIRKFINNIEELLRSKDDEEAKQELVILNSYLPKQLTVSEMEKEIDDMIQNQPDVKIGDIMNHFKKTFNGQYSGKELSILIKQKLG